MALPYEYTLRLADGTLIGFDNYFDDDDPGSGWIDVTMRQSAYVISGSPQPISYVYDYEYLAREPEQEDDNGYTYIYNHWKTISGQQFAGYDNLSFVSTFNVSSRTLYDYFDIPDIESRSNSLRATHIGLDGITAELVLDFTAASGSRLIDLANDRAGVVWINEKSADSLKLSLAAITNQGSYTTRSVRIDTGELGLSGADADLVAATSTADGQIAAALLIDGEVFVHVFSPRLELLYAVAVGDELAGLIALPGGGLVVGSVEHDGSGSGATLTVFGLDEGGRPATIWSFDIEDYAGSSLSLQADGSVGISWTDGDDVHTRDYLPTGETHQGGPGENELIGTTWRDTLWGEGGKDALHGLGGNDGLYGGDGNDELFGGLGADIVDGGIGRDVAAFASRVTLDLARPQNSAGEAGGDSYIGIEGYRGSGEADRMVGDGVANTFYGEAGNDVLSGGAGDDILLGGAGADRQRGGAGADQFRFNLPGDGGDVIADFASGVDRIVIREGGFGLSGLNFVAGDDPAPGDSEAVLLYASSTGILSFDADGNGAQTATIIATLSNRAALSEADFLLV